MEFIECSRFEGALKGFVFKRGASGLGYYADAEARADGHAHSSAHVHGRGAAMSMSTSIGHGAAAAGSAAELEEVTISPRSEIAPRSNEIVTCGAGGDSTQWTVRTGAAMHDLMHCCARTDPLHAGGVQVPPLGASALPCPTKVRTRPLKGT